MLSTLLLLAAQAAPTQPCAACHVGQAAQYKTSMHSESLQDPLYLAMRAWARDEAGQAAASACMTCHAVGTFEGRTIGVDCEACHQSRTEAGPRGLTARADLPVRARQRVDAPHATIADAQLVSGTSCLICHAELRNRQAPAGLHHWSGGVREPPGARVSELPPCSRLPGSRSGIAGARCDARHRATATR